MGNVLTKCNLSEDEAEIIFREFDGSLTRQEEEALDEKFSKYCFYDSWGRKNFRECICTNCGGFDVYKNEHEYFFKGKHGDVTRCPECGEEVKLYCLGRMRSGAGLKEWQRAAFLRKASDGGVLLIGGYATKEYSRNDLRPTITWYEKSRTYLAPGKRGQWRRELHNYWNMFYCGYEPAKWERSASVAEPFNPAMQQHDGSYWLIGWGKIEDTSLKYCQCEEWFREVAGIWLCEESDTVRQVYKYLARYTEYPNMEMAVKIGMHRAVEELVMDGRKNHRVLNWKAKTVQGFLRMNKQDARAFLEAGGDIGQLVHYREALETGSISSVREYLQMMHEIGTMANLTKTATCAGIAGVEIRQAVKYIRKQADNWEEKTGNHVGNVLSYWRDYLDAAVHLQYDLTNETVSMPKDLKQRHDAATQMVKLQASAEARKKYQKRYKELVKKYEFRLGDFCVIVPKCAEEIVAEGKTLNHCVGGYANRHLEGMVDILFIRYARKPGRSFLTVEMVPQRQGIGRPAMRQIHGYKNENYQNAPQAPREKYAWFINAWMGWLAGGSKRDSKGQPVMSAGKEQTA